MVSWSSRCVYWTASSKLAGCHLIVKNDGDDLDMLLVTTGSLQGIGNMIAVSYELAVGVSAAASRTVCKCFSVNVVMLVTSKCCAILPALGNQSRLGYVTAGG